MVTLEGEFPKEDSDPKYASEYNNFFYETRFDILKFPKRTSSGDLHYTTNGNITDNFIYCDSLTIDSGVTMTVPLGTGPVYFYVDGDVSIEGDIKAWGVAGPTGYSGSFGDDQNAKRENIGEEVMVGTRPQIGTNTLTSVSGGTGGSGYSNGGSEGYGDIVSMGWSYSPTFSDLKKIVAMKGYGHLIGCSGGVGGRDHSGYTPAGVVDAGGGSGGCIIIVATGNITISGKIDCDGKSPANSTMTVAGRGSSSGSGGGAGGTIILLAGNSIDGTSGTLTADGGKGANGTTQGGYNYSGGGGGSGGFVGLYCLGTYTSFSSITVTGGAGGSGSPSGYNGSSGENGATYINGV